MHDHSGGSHSHSHFEGKSAMDHVAEAQAQGLLAAAEIHGTEIPGYISAACDAARDSAMVFPLLWILFSFLNISTQQMFPLLAIFAGGWLLWKMGRSAWMGWFRLERLHRVLEQERWEIEHHRQQEREELAVLYAAKGFEGKLLEDVLDVLMADDSRLLKVMVEEEMGLTLASYEHPLKQGLGAGSGVLVSTLICLFTFALWHAYGIFLGAFIVMSMASYLLARLSRNDTIPAIVWNVGLAILSLGWVYFLLNWLVTLRNM